MFFTARFSTLLLDYLEFFYLGPKLKTLFKLVWNVKEGWAPLCEFLGKPIPDCPLPHDNKTGSNWFEEYG